MMLLYFGAAAYSIIGDLPFSSVVVVLVVVLALTFLP
jgi:hypothetical protein